MGNWKEDSEKFSVGVQFATLGSIAILTAATLQGRSGSAPVHIQLMMLSGLLFILAAGSFILMQLSSKTLAAILKWIFAMSAGVGVLAFFIAGLMVCYIYAAQMAFL